MVAFTKINDYVEHVHEGVHNHATHQHVIALSNTAPASETSNPTADGNGVLANVTQVAYTFLGSRNITLTSSAQTSGTYKLTLTDITMTSTGGSTGPFRYVYVYNDTPTSPADPLIGLYDNGSAITLNDGESLTVDFDDANGVLTDA